MFVWGPVIRGAIGGGGKELSGLAAGRELSTLVVEIDELAAGDGVNDVGGWEWAVIIVDVSFEGLGWNDICLVGIGGDGENDEADGADGAGGADGETCQSKC